MHVHGCCAGSSEGREGVRTLAELQAEAKLQLKRATPPAKGRNFRPMVPLGAVRQPNPPGSLFSRMTRPKVRIDAAVSRPHHFVTLAASPGARWALTLANAGRSATWSGLCVLSVCVGDSWAAQYGGGALSWEVSAASLLSSTSQRLAGSFVLRCCLGRTLRL